MMLFFLLLQAVTPAAPADLSVLPPVPYIAPPQMTAPLVRFVADEIAAGRCTPPRPADGHYVIKLNVATLVGADGAVRQARPDAIDCPTVEQYAAGLVIRFARSNIQPRPGSEDSWYRATIVFDWQG